MDANLMLASRVRPNAQQAEGHARPRPRRGLSIKSPFDPILGLRRRSVMADAIFDGDFA